MKFDRIGTIAILKKESPDLVEAAKKAGAKTILLKTGKTSGEARITPYKIIWGEQTETVHRENGCRYLVDPTRVYFNPRLGGERKRITDLTKKGEKILGLFCGVGPFLIPAARKGANITGVEKNKTACKYFKQNLKLNQTQGEIIQGDAKLAPSFLNTTFDRIIMPTPYGCDFYLEDTLPLVKKGGRIHFYTFKKEPDLPLTSRWMKTLGLTLTGFRRCGNTSPGVGRYCLDLVKV